MHPAPVYRVFSHVKPATSHSLSFLFVPALHFKATLKHTRLDDGGRALGGTTAGAQRLNGLDDILGVVIRDFTEDDVAAIEPRSDDGRDEKLGAVGVGASICHAEEEGLGVLELEVLVREFLAIDRLAAGALRDQHD